MQVTFANEDLRPLVQAVVTETLQQIRADSGLIGDRLAFGEAEAARLLGYKQHQLRDERLDGRINASVGRGGRILYARDDLLQYLAERRFDKT